MTPWEKQRENARKKLADPEWRAAQYERAKASQARQRERQREKMATPEYKEKCRVQAEQARERSRLKASEKAAQTPAPKKPKLLPAKTPAKRATSSKGLKGRSLSAEERRLWDVIGAMPCVACTLHGKHSPIVSLHHIKGRTIKDAHKFVLPLCDYHHQGLAPADVRAEFPWLIPIHAAGKIGGRKAFILLNADEATLYQMVMDKVINFSNIKV
ncbi:Ref family recombination enhancement nuclease [Klebsiella michiganensis]|nr:recombinase [Klebsiella michiganensis]